MFLLVRNVKENLPAREKFQENVIIGIKYTE
jgi:hypothetical protein